MADIPVPKVIVGVPEQSISKDELKSKKAEVEHEIRNVDNALHKLRATFNKLKSMEAKRWKILVTTTDRFQVLTQQLCKERTLLFKKSTRLVASLRFDETPKQQPGEEEATAATLKQQPPTHELTSKLPAPTHELTSKLPQAALAPVPY